MTLVDLFRLIRRYWVLILVVTAACGALGGAYTMLGHDSGDDISATASIVGNSQAGGVLGLAREEGRQVTFDDGTKFEEEGCEYEMTAAVESGTQTVMVTVSGPDEEECVSLANSIAEKAYGKALEWYPGKDNVLAYSGHVERADKATVEEAAGSSAKYLLVAVLAGLFLGICIVVVIDMVRRPVKSIEGMQDLVELPVLEKLPAESGERLLANIRFAGGKDDLSRVCVVPLGGGGAAADVCALLDGAMRAEEAGGESAGRDAFRAVACEPLSSGMGGAYEAREADAAVVVARQWADSLAALEGTVAELRLAGANVVGLVFAG